jgi:hypothetical protein
MRKTGRPQEEEPKGTTPSNVAKTMRLDLTEIKNCSKSYAIVS